MVDLRKKLEIIQRHLAGDTNRQIARGIGLNRKTVDKYVREWREAQAAAVREAVEATTGTLASRAEQYAGYCHAIPRSPYRRQPNRGSR
jgi:transposase-like protein